MTFIVSQTITYRRLLRFGFDVLESGKFKCQSETRQRDAPWCMIIHVGLRRCSSSTDRAISGASIREAGIRKAPRFVLFLAEIKNFVLYPSWSLAEMFKHMGYGLCIKIYWSHTGCCGLCCDC